MIALIIVAVLLLIFVPGIRKYRVQSGRARSPIEPGKPRRSLPRSEAGAEGEAPAPAASGGEAKPAGKPTVESLMDDFAEGRLSVEEYEHRLDEIYRNDST